MATLAALKFNTSEGAKEALEILKNLENQRLIQIEDAAIVTWEKGKKRPSTDHGKALVGLGALDGGFWGLLFGILFFMPLLGTIIGAATGALAGAFSNVGIDQDFINSIRANVTEGTSALFVLSDAAVVDRVVPELKKLNPHVVATNLPADKEAALRAMFA